MLEASPFASKSGLSFRRGRGHLSAREGQVFVSQFEHNIVVCLFELNLFGKYDIVDVD